MSYRLSIDTGGTFTDVAMVNETNGEMKITKLPSTPENPSEAILKGINIILEENNLNNNHITQFIHGTTVATNALLEKKGTKMALITTKGFKDVLELGRQARPHLYDFKARKPEELVPR